MLQRPSGRLPPRSTRPLPVRRQADLALAVEPSDGVMLPGIALFDHRNGRIARSLGDPPTHADFGLGIRRHRRHRGVQRPGPRRGTPAASGTLPGGARDSSPPDCVHADAELVGRGATESALAHQRVLPKPQLPAVLALGRAAGAVGVNVAHSGTVMGLMFGEDAERVRWAAHHVSRRLPGLLATHEHRVIGGGVMQHGAARERERPATRQVGPPPASRPFISAAVQRS